MAFDIRNEKLADEEFFKKRNEVLKQWETGRQVADLNENMAAARELSQDKSYALTLAEHKINGTNLFEPQFGQALTEYMIEGIGYVEANSDLYPPRVEEAHAMIAWNAIVDIMGGFTNIVLKCEDEAFATPTKEGMANSVRLARHLITLLGAQKLPECEEMKLEEKMIEMEVRAVLDKSLEAGDGDILVGLCTAVECGWFDTMVSPWKHVKGKVRYIRDAENALRYFDTGNIPIPKEAKEYNDAKLREREKKQKIKLTFDTLVHDLQFASRLPAPVK